MLPAASKQVGPEFGSTELGAMEAFLSQGEAPVFLGLLLILGFRGLGPGFRYTLMPHCFGSPKP